MKHDIDIGTLHPGSALLKDFLASFTYEGPLLLVSVAKSAIPLYLDTHTHPLQFLSLEYTHGIETILSSHKNIHFQLTLSWNDNTLVGFKRAKQLGKYTICTTPLA
jgi:hypothetical protein